MNLKEQIAELSRAKDKAMENLKQLASEAGNTEFSSLVEALENAGTDDKRVFEIIDKVANWKHGTNV